MFRLWFFRWGELTRQDLCMFSFHAFVIVSVSSYLLIVHSWTYPVACCCTVFYIRIFCWSSPWDKAACEGLRITLISWNLVRRKSILNNTSIEKNGNNSRQCCKKSRNMDQLQRWNAYLNLDKILPLKKKRSFRRCFLGSNMVWIFWPVMCVVVSQREVQVVDLRVSGTRCLRGVLDFHSTFRMFWSFTAWVPGIHGPEGYLPSRGLVTLEFRPEESRATNCPSKSNPKKVGFFSNENHFQRIMFGSY